MERFTNLRVILAQGHANLLFIIPVLVYVLPKRARIVPFRRDDGQPLYCTAKTSTRPQAGTQAFGAFINEGF